MIAFYWQFGHVHAKLDPPTSKGLWQRPDSKTSVMLSTVTMIFVLNDYTLLAPLKPPEISEGCVYVSEEYIVVFKTTASEDQGEDGCTQNLLWLVFFV